MELALFNERRTRFTTRERVGRVFEDISAFERSGVSSKETNRGKRMKIYIAGKITGDNEYKKKFYDAECALIDKGHTVMNPAILPAGFEWGEYMAICLQMQSVCDGTLFLPDWKDSQGARLENIKARNRYYSIDDIPSG